jgi:hypothetical protein
MYPLGHPEWKEKEKDVSDVLLHLLSYLGVARSLVLIFHLYVYHQTVYPPYQTSSQTLPLSQYLAAIVFTHRFSLTFLFCPSVSRLCYPPHLCILSIVRSTRESFLALLTHSLSPLVYQDLSCAIRSSRIVCYCLNASRQALMYQGPKL